MLLTAEMLQRKVELAVTASIKEMRKLTERPVGQQPPNAAPR